MDILGFIGGIFKPAADLIDSVHTSDEERLELRNAFAIIQNGLLEKLLDYEKRLMKLKGKIIEAEITSGVWISKAWRPITMLVFLFLIVLDSINWLPKPLNPDAWMVLKIGLGGYVGGRSVEKAVASIAKIIKK